MSVIVWDGKTLAADRQGSNNGMCFIQTKLRHLDPDTVVAWTGDVAYALMLLEWFKAGEDPKTFPDFQKQDAIWVRLIVWRRGSAPYYYEQVPAKIYVEGGFMAWGAGRDYAMGALYAGADARKAVAIANALSDSCGFDADYVTF